ncbi:MAG: hypothetical protein K2Y31_00495 [Burkholderiales bacterium]|jgi:hypothetical protein|nr:hypothetical protein [Burkholderiales bacterium]
MLKKLEVLVDATSWGAASPPAALIALNKTTRQVNVVQALINTAQLTRPPKVTGFHLSDYWACLRYLPALSNSSWLELCKDWDSVDPHQKTVMSDELGMGFSAQLVSEVFNCPEFVDTIYVMRVLHPGKFSLSSGNKRGPKKSPDFIAEDGSGNFVALECKGTQTSRKELLNALGRGAKQKKSLTAVAGTRISHSLVAGLFIPQWSNVNRACIHVADPTWSELDTLLADTEAINIRKAIIQIGLAKQLALAGFVELPNLLSNTGIEYFGELTQRVRNEINQYAHVKSQMMDADGYRLAFDTAELRARTPGVIAQRQVRFFSKVTEDLLKILRESETVEDIRGELVKRQRRRPLISEKDNGSSVGLNTMLGVEFRADVAESEGS